MRTRRFLLFLLGVVGLSGAAAWITRSPQSAARATAPPVVPAPRQTYNPEQVHQTLEVFAARSRRDPQDAISRVMLARWSLESYRETGDVADALRAEKAARESISIRSSNNGEAFAQLSRALVTQHRFAEALVAARRAARYDSEAYRQCADIEIELGDYAAAQRDLAKSVSQATDPAYLALGARLLEVQGKQSQAVAALQMAARAAQANVDMPPQSVAWFHERLGHALSLMGRLDEAEQSYRAALQVFPRDYRSMAALARLYAARNNWQQTLVWAKKAAAILPAPETLSLMGDAYAASGQEKQAQQQYQLVEQIGGLARAQGVLYDRQRALFYADHNRNLEEALTLARGELKIRHDIYTHDTLAWVLFKNGKLPEAAKEAKLALAWNTQDASLWYHAGMIAHAQSQNERAQMLLQRALKINSFFHPTAPQQVRALLAELDTARRTASLSP